MTEVQKTKPLFAWLDVISVVTVVALYLIDLYLITAHDPIVWVDLFFDDAYYYLGVARSLAEGAGSQFAPPLDTNGYHPLWLLLLWALAELFGHSDKALAIELLTLMFGSVLAAGVACRLLYGVMFPAIVASLMFAMSTLSGLETALVPLLAVLLLAQTRWYGRGVLGSLLFLARLEALALVVAQDVYDLLWNRRLRLAHYAVVVSVVLAYLGVNQFLFGVPVPVSGLAKSVGARLGENTEAIRFYLRSAGYVLPLFVPLVVLQFAERKRVFLRYGRELSATALTVLACAAYHALSTGWDLWPWYNWPALLIAIYVLLEFAAMYSGSPAPAEKPADSLAAGALRVVALSAVVLYCSLAAGRVVTKTVATLGEATHPASLAETTGRKNVELSALVKCGEIAGAQFFAMGDRAGSFGFFLDNRYGFVQTEGLVANVQFYRAASKDAVPEFLETLPITHLVVDREQYLKDGSTIGVIEPALALSAHRGPFMLCFDRGAIVLDQSFEIWRRYVFDYRAKIPCPTALTAEFEKLRSTYSGVYRYANPTMARASLLDRVLLYKRPALSIVHSLTGSAE